MKLGGGVSDQHQDACEESANRTGKERGSEGNKVGVEKETPSRILKETYGGKPPAGPWNPTGERAWRKEPHDTPVRRKLPPRLDSLSQPGPDRGSPQPERQKQEIKFINSKVNLKKSRLMMNQNGYTCTLRSPRSVAMS